MWYYEDFLLQIRYLFGSRFQTKDSASITYYGVVASYFVVHEMVL